MNFFGRQPESPKRRPHAAGRGFTLLELIIYFGIIGMVLTAAVGFSATFISMQVRNGIYQDIGRDGRYAVARMAAEVRAADSVDLGGSDFGVSPGRLSLAMADPAADPTVFSVSGNTLTVSRGGGTAYPVLSSSSAVSSFVLENVSVSGRSRTFRIRLELASTDTSQRPVEQVFETTATIRKGRGHAN